MSAGRTSKALAGALTLFAAVQLSVACGVGEDATFADGRAKSDDAKSEQLAPLEPRILPGEEAGQTPILGYGEDNANGGNTDLPPLVGIPKTASIFWGWPCAAAAGDVPPPTDPLATVILGSGEFVLAEPQGANVAVEIAGRFCAADTSVRDVVFAIDVSNSMRDFLNLGNDPVRYGTCGRVAAVSAVLTSLGPAARVALVTFDERIRVDSGAFRDVAAFTEMYVNVETLCARGSGTDYRLALGRVEELALAARDAAARDVYFISDGQPNVAEDGMDEAARIRLRAVVATMIVRGDDKLLKDSIASRDKAGEPLHANVREPNEMAATIAALQAADVVAAAVEFGPVDGGVTRVDLDVASSLSFRIPEAALPAAGLVVRLEARDSRGAVYGGRGLIIRKP